MENKQELSAHKKTLRTRLNPGPHVKTFFKFVFGILVVFSSIAGSQIFRATPKAVPNTPAPEPVVSAAARHSTLNVDVFHKFVTRNSQHMYPRLSKEIVGSAIKYSEKYDLSPIMVLAVAEAESQFNPFAVSKQNARGLMQINPDANEKLLVQEGIIKDTSELFDPDRNIEAGCFLLRRFINNSSDFNTALDKYLGAESTAYKAEIHQVMGKVLLLGITEELNKTSDHKIQPIIKVEPPSKSS
jgi:soluble lytic murein transglycosylase